jgi:ABC-type dipeptide/oligopeptide/nickel transport system permease component
MKNYFIKKIIIMLFILFTANSLVFFIIRLIPGDPAIAITGNMINKENLLETRKKFNLDKPIIIQYKQFIKNSITFNFGESFTHKKPVLSVICKYFPNTIYLALLSMTIAIFISFILGILSVLYTHSKINVFITLLSSSFLAIPNFLLGTILILIFSVYFKLLPVSGSGSFKFLILPSLTLSLSMTAFLVKIIRTSFNSEMDKPYVLFAKAKGLSQINILFKHILKNAMIPVLTVMGLQFGALISGVIVTENVFSWQGIGTLLICSIKNRYSVLSILKM